MNPKTKYTKYQNVQGSDTYINQKTKESEPIRRNKIPNKGRSLSSESPAMNRREK